MIRQLRNALHRAIVAKETRLGERAWAGVPQLDRDAAGAAIAGSIRAGRAFGVGKIGANEQNLLHWAHGIAIPSLVPKPIFYYQTRYLATNAGIVPRSRASYREFGRVLADRVGGIDLLGTWSMPGERRLVQRFAKPGVLFTHFLNFDPWFMAEPWSAALEGKRVFVVSPFADSIERQMARREAIFPGRKVLPPCSVTTFRFPYLVDPACSETWQGVFEAVRREMDATDFDVALLGCGGLGLPLAAEAARRGKVGVHLGGMLQILFGIRGKRYDDSPPYAAMINEAWVRPSPEEIPPVADRIEERCYW